MNRGIVLVGGGARAAYQAGVLKGIAKIAAPSNERPLFDVMVGASAGAINAAYLASRAHEPVSGIKELHRLWANLKMEDVLDVSTLRLTRIAGSWMRDLMFGGSLRSNYLVDANPVGNLIQRKIDFDQIRENIERGILCGFALTTTNYKTGTTITFFDSDPDVPNWERSGRIGVRACIRKEHLLASASIPILFKPVTIGACQFGDGSIRQSAPLSPAIHLGSDQILAISVQYQRPTPAAYGLEPPPDTQTSTNGVASPRREISLAGVVGRILNAAFSEGLDFDSERLLRINRTLEYYSEFYAEKTTDDVPLLDVAEKPKTKTPLSIRRIPLLMIRPSEDLGILALNHFKKFPRLLRHLMKGIGASDEDGADLMSYLAFDKDYTRELLALGERDAKNHEKQIQEFFEMGVVREVPLAKPSLTKDEVARIAINEQKAEQQPIFRGDL